jgi:hypothetical protein
MFGGLVCPRDRIPLTVSGLVQVCRLASAIALGAGCVGAIPAADGAGAPASGGAGPSSVPRGAPPPPACGGELAPARIWRLSDEQYRRAVADLLPGVTVPEVSTPGRSGAEFVDAADLFPASGALVADLHSAARAVAAAAVVDLPSRMGCAAGQAERACAEAFIDRFAARAYRRPLEAADRQALAALFAAGAAESVRAGVELVIEGILQSPSFLYRTELGAPGAGPRFELTAHERASALSFFLLGSIPDEGLVRAANDGSLATPEGYRRQIERLLADARVRQNLGRVFGKWVGLGAGITTELDPDQYPGYDDALKQSMVEESARVFDDLLARGGTFTDLLTGRRTFVDQRLAALYGLPAPGAGFVEVMLPAAERAGLLTRAAFITNQSRGEPIVHRGKWVREELLCGEMPEPPAGVNTTPPVDPNLTARQFAQMRMADGSCSACHALMDGIGLTFGHYDALARFVTKDDQGRPIDASGQVEGSDVAGPASDVLQLSQRLAGSAQVRACVETRMLSYALGRELDPEAARCEQQRIDAAIAGGGHRLLDLMGAIAGAPSFQVRGQL